MTDELSGRCLGLLLARMVSALGGGVAIYFTLVLWSDTVRLHVAVFPCTFLAHLISRTRSERRAVLGAFIPLSAILSSDLEYQYFPLWMILPTFL